MSSTASPVKSRTAHRSMYKATIGLDQIGQALLSIQKTASETLTSTRQAERAAQNLNALAQSLQQMVARYRLT